MKFLMVFNLINILFMSNNMAEMFNFPKEVDGWQLEDNAPEIYTPETLYDYIDGNAEVYISLGVREVLVYRYKKPTNEEIVIDIFDMGSSSSAYGAYHNDIRDLPGLDIGVESELMSNSLTFWKDKYFVVITGIGESKDIKDDIIKLGKFVDSKISNKGEPPFIATLLPQKGLVKSQIHYFKNYDLLKVRFYLSEEDPFLMKEGCEGIVARYKLSKENEDFFIFIVKYPSEKDTTDAIQKLKKLCTETSNHTQGYTKSLSNRNSSFFAINNYLILILDFKDENVIEKYKKELIALLSKRR